MSHVYKNLPGWEAWGAKDAQQQPPPPPPAPEDQVAKLAAHFESSGCPKELAAKMAADAVKNLS